MVKRFSVNELLEKHQIRKTRGQKQGFRDWFKTHATQYNYEVVEHSYKQGRGTNLMVGNVKKADVILTAHYDTAASSIFPVTTIIGSIPKYLLGQLLMIIPIVLLATGFGILTSFLIGIAFGDGMLQIYLFEALGFSLIFILIWGWQMMAGFANQKNVNDNTSGMAVLIALLEDLPLELREKVCFVIFDEEEKGLVGAQAFKKKYLEDVFTKPLINFDCVGHGDHLMFITKKQFRESALQPLLKEAVGNKAMIKEARHYFYPSDQIIFKSGVGVAAVHRAPILGYYLSRLHSSFDTKLNENNIERLKEMMIEFISKIGKEEA